MLGDPFAVDPLPRAYYHPSPERKLTKNEKSLAISPSRRVGARDENRIPPNDRLSPMDELFLQGSNSYRTKISAEPVEDNLDETWPSTERPSSVSFTGLDDSDPAAPGYQEAVDRFNDLRQKLTFPDHEINERLSTKMKPEKTTATDKRTTNKLRPGKVTLTAPTATKTQKEKTKPSQIPRAQIGKSGRDVGKKQGKGSQPDQADQPGPSVLQKYIERFRNSAPTSRDERQRRCDKGSQDFWWLSKDGPGDGISKKGRPAEEVPIDEHLTPSDSSTPIDEATGGKKSRRFTPLSVENLDKYDQLYDKKLKKELVPPSPGDRRTRELQERAERLLERSNSSLASTDPAVSTEGLGSVLTVSDVSGLEDYPVRPRFAQFADIDGYRKTDTGSKRQPIPPSRPTKAEDDVLHQWRLRRKMDQAKETAPKNVQSFGFLTKTDQEKKIEEKLEEFKRKLAASDAPRPSPRVPVSDVQFTPAPDRPSVKEGGTQKPGQPSSYPYQPEEPTRQNQLAQEYSRSDQSEPVIASPVLQRRKKSSDATADVDPHLHLMCDLLPCPHQGSYAQKYREGRASSEDGNEHYSKNSEEEALKQKYKQFLPAEKPDVEQSLTEQDSESGSVRSEERRKKEKRDSPRSGSSVNDQHHSGEKRKEHDRHSDKVNRQGDCSATDNGRTSDGRRKGKERSVKEQRSEGKGRKEQSSGKGQEKESSVPRPKPSASPVQDRPAVEDTIGQVVQDRLFNFSTNTVLSSVESLPPVASLDRSRQDKVQVSPPSPRQEETEAGYESDGEFADDQLLSLLRRQRSQFEAKLRDIDQLLDNYSGR